MSKEIHIVMADDHPIFRRGLRTVIEADPLLRIVAEADNQMFISIPTVEHHRSNICAKLNLTGKKRAFDFRPHAQRKTHTKGHIKHKSWNPSLCFRALLWLE